MNQDEVERVRRDRIERRAYEIYQSRGGQHGLDQEDWLKAESEVDGLPPNDDRLPEPEQDEDEKDQPLGPLTK